MEGGCRGEKNVCGWLCVCVLGVFLLFVSLLGGGRRGEVFIFGTNWKLRNSDDKSLLKDCYCYLLSLSLKPKCLAAVKLFPASMICYVYPIIHEFSCS